MTSRKPLTPEQRARLEALRAELDVFRADLAADREAFMADLAADRDELRAAVRELWPAP